MSPLATVAAATGRVLGAALVEKLAMGFNIPLPISSGLINSASYNVGGNLTLELDGDKYTYSGVPQHLVVGLLVAKSPAEYFNEHIKGNYSYERG